MYKRSEFHVIKDRHEEPRRFIQVVMGPSQIGKSTVVKQVLNELKHPFQFFSADNVPATDRAWISNCWAATRAMMESNQEKSMILVINEIQKIKNWSEVVKKEWDSRPGRNPSGRFPEDGSPQAVLAILYHAMIHVGGKFAKNFNCHDTTSEIYLADRNNTPSREDIA